MPEIYTNSRSLFDNLTAIAIFISIVFISRLNVRIGFIVTIVFLLFMAHYLLENKEQMQSKNDKLLQ